MQILDESYYSNHRILSAGNRCQEPVLGLKEGAVVAPLLQETRLWDPEAAYGTNGRFVSSNMLIGYLFVMLFSKWSFNSTVTL
jgi:hypothetical protein